MIYTERELLRLARRHHNTRRTYLLINPLQGKHIPVTPSEALSMMRTLGEHMAGECPEIDLVIGFAETATAVAAMAAAGLGHPCRYIQTTREGDLAGTCLEFREEHSHAAEQLLSLERLAEWVDRAKGVAFVDDELSTGRTMVNAVESLRMAFPSLFTKPIIAASIISRLSDERMSALQGEGIQSVSLLRLPAGDYTQAVSRYQIHEAEAPNGRGMAYRGLVLPEIGDARRGVSIPEWMERLNDAFDAIIDELLPRLSDRRVTVLGTEEYMLPGLLLGAKLEGIPAIRSVKFHATTRSPIGICQDGNYPIQTGYKLHSLYDAARTTYIYDLQPCDAAVIVTDSPDDEALRRGMGDLSAALRGTGCRDIILIREARHVQHL